VKQSNKQILALSNTIDRSKIFL